MEIRFESPTPEGRTLRTHAERRVRFVTRRLAWMVPAARIALDRATIAPNAPDKRCLIELETGLGRPIVVTAFARNFAAALDTAVSSAGRALVRAWRKTFEAQRDGVSRVHAGEAGGRGRPGLGRKRRKGAPPAVPARVAVVPMRTALRST